MSLASQPLTGSTACLGSVRSVRRRWPWRASWRAQMSCCWVTRSSGWNGSRMPRVRPRRWRRLAPWLTPWRILPRSCLPSVSIATSRWSSQMHITPGPQSAVLKVDFSENASIGEQDEVHAATVTSRRSPSSMQLPGHRRTPPPTLAYQRAIPW